MSSAIVPATTDAAGRVEPNGGTATNTSPIAFVSGLEQALVILRRRWKLLFACALLATAAAVGFSVTQQKRYTASSSLLFSDTQFDQELFGSNFTPSTVDPVREAATNVDLASLPTVAQRTAAALHLSERRVHSEVSVSAVGQADIAKISVTDVVPARAASIANMYVQQYVLFRQEADRSKITGAQDLVQRRLSALPPRQRSSSVGQALQNRANQLGVLAALQTGNAEVAQNAGIPSAPSSPQPERNGILGLVGGLLLGAGLIYVAERLDRRIRVASELELAYGVPLLGSVPESSRYVHTGREPLPAAEAEAFALLRARLRYFNVDREVRTLLLSSATPGEGKTTVALNLAIAEAMAGDSNVVLVEADLRRPDLARRLGLRGGPGLAEVLSRNAALDTVIREVTVPPAASNHGSSQFALIAAGTIPPNPAQLVESRSMIDLLSTLAERFDLVIVDSAPTSIVPDAIPLMRLVSGVVVVGRIERTTRDAARHLSEQLTKLRAPVLGVVANAMPKRTQGQYGYGYYRDDDVTNAEVTGASDLRGIQLHEVESLDE
ncbi:MAG: polysaccharide biosynthesis tyrosine autokinase [Solirubrobacterales bacterium]|nr:polysaccharide biosynthesis tyrosine autokinase [Solirubrobacterales bacterium]